MPDLPHDLTEAGWQTEPGGKAIIKAYRFATFRDAITWMLRGGFEAEKLDHHPEWTNVYNRVSVRLTTHDTDGVTDKDFALARRLDAV